MDTRQRIIEAVQQHWEYNARAPMVDDIARDCELARKTVLRHIRLLIADGTITADPLQPGQERTGIRVVDGATEDTGSQGIHARIADQRSAVVDVWQRNLRRLTHGLDDMPEGYRRDMIDLVTRTLEVLRYDQFHKERGR